MTSLVFVASRGCSHVEVPSCQPRNKLLLNRGRSVPPIVLRPNLNSLPYSSILILDSAISPFLHGSVFQADVQHRLWQARHRLLGTSERRTSIEPAAFAIRRRGGPGPQLQHDNRRACQRAFREEPYTEQPPISSHHPNTGSPNQRHRSSGRPRAPVHSSSLHFPNGPA